MAKSITSWSDYFSGFFTLAILLGVGYIAYMAQQAIQSGVAGAKKSLKDGGITLDENGMSVKTDRRGLTTEEYVTAQSQAMLNSSKRLAKSGAVSFGKGVESVVGAGGGKGGSK